MYKTALKTTYKIFSLLLVMVLPLNMTGKEVYAATTATTLNQTITAGTLSINIVDSGGSIVGSPSVAFASKSFLFVPQDSAATLGTASEKIRLDNPTSTATWNISIAATDGDVDVWDAGGGLTYPYNDVTSADNGRLTVDPSTGTITPWSGCTNTNVTLGTSDTFISASVSSIDLLTAAAGADTFCRWDLTGVSMSQRIPANQAAGTYSIGMTLTAI